MEKKKKNEQETRIVNVHIENIICYDTANLIRNDSDMQEGKRDELID